jgi:hypothetical protein
MMTRRYVPPPRHIVMSIAGVVWQAAMFRVYHQNDGYARDRVATYQASAK